MTQQLVINVGPCENSGSADSLYTAFSKCNSNFSALFTSGPGAVTSVGVSVFAGLGVSGSPITTNGTISITTSLSGIIKGTGSGFVQATSGVDYLAPDGNGSALTGLTASQVGLGPTSSPTFLAVTLAGGVTEIASDGTVTIGSGLSTIRPNGSAYFASGNFVIASSGAASISGSPVLVQGTPPASSTASGTVGQIAWDSNYLYVCYAANSWARADLSVW